MTHPMSKKFKTFLPELLILALLALGTLAFGQTESTTTHGANWFTDQTEAQTWAAENEAHILMVFAGSDWCRYCMQFDREVLAQTTFKDYATDKIAILFLDFPSRKKNRLDKEQRKHNDALADKYNRSGIFPKILLFDAEYNLYGGINFTGQDADNFVQELTEMTADDK